MRLIEIGIASLDSTVGAVRSNTDAVLAAAREMASAGVTVGCFPEQAIGGYPAEDLVQWRAFVASQRSELDRLATETADLAMVLVVGLVASVGGRLFNVAAVVHGGEILGMVPKEKLPTYGVFYERRTLASGAPRLELDAGGVPLGDQIFGFDFGLVAVEVCEDAWSVDGPMRRRCYSGAELTINLSASPYRIGVEQTRREMLATRSGDNEATLVYANAVGAQDGLIFDGGGYVFQNGRLVLAASRFREGWESSVVDLDRTLRLRSENSTWRSDCAAYLAASEPVRVMRAKQPGADRSTLDYPAPERGAFFLPGDGERLPSRRQSVLDELYEALALGVKDYFAKTGAFRCFGIALSGGRDSLLTLLVARRAVELLEPDLEGEALERRCGEMITAFYMPSRHSLAATEEAARTICRELGVRLETVSIDEAYQRELEAVREMLGGEEPSRITRQNIQARLRGSRMWNWANTSGALFLQTGDMSEKAVGYTTIGGDLEGALSVIANVPKTMVIALLERLHERFAYEGIARTLETAPGPELADDQEAEDELMPFPVLDACLYLYAGEKLTPDEVALALAAAFPDQDRERLERWAREFADRFVRSIYKWVQAPISLHVGTLDLERERALQLPVVERQEWRE